jgi:hypothetical protein
VTAFPLPGGGEMAVAVPAPAAGPGNWAGAPSAALAGDGSIAVAYRVRTAGGRGGATVVARSGDGVRLTEVVRLEKERFGAESLERPALVRVAADLWRLYVSCATPGSKHWRVDLLEAASLEALAAAEPVTVFPGSELEAEKDPVVRPLAGGGWAAWVCCHPLDRAGAEDRMTTAYATSADGRAWRRHGTALGVRPGEWDARGARVTAVLPDGRASYDGRASAEENFSERTGLAAPAGPDGRLEPVGDEPVSTARYLDVLPVRGGFRLYYEAPLADGSHELRTELVA